MNPHILNEILELTQDLISIPSTHSRPQELCRCCTFIEDWFKRFNITTQLYNFDGIPSLAILPYPSKSPVIFSSHFDVVEAENSELFTPAIKDGKLYGRGAIDDKYAIAMSMVLFREHHTRLLQNGKSRQDMVFGLLLTGDEEIGGKNGVGAIIPDIETDFFIVLDGGSPSEIVTCEKGILLLELNSNGRSAHAARPWLGASGFDILMDDYIQIKKLFAESHDNHWHKTVVLSNCIAGNGSTNMLPGSAKATLDIRITENDDVDALISEIHSVTQSDVCVLSNEPCFRSLPSDFMNLLANNIPDAKFVSEHGASDARYFSKKGISGVIWGADGEMTQHTENEYLLIDSIIPVYSGLNNFIDEIEKISAETGPLNFSQLKN